MSIASAREKNNLLSLIFLIFFVLDALFLGYVLQQYLPKISTVIYSDQTKSPVVVQLLQSAGKKRTKQEYRSYMDTISQVAIKSTNMVVADCTLSPLITTTEKSSSLTINNIGTTTTFITLGKEEPFRIEPHGAVTTDLSFVEGTPSVIGIGCSGKKEAAGILYIPK